MPRTKLARLPLPFGLRLAAPDADYEAVRDDLDDLVYSRLDCLTADALLAVLPMTLKRRQRVAVLCRNNGQALMLSGRLHEAGIPHRLQRRAAERAVGPWLAAAFGQYEGGDIDRVHFLEVVESCAVKPTIELDEAWRAVRRSAQADGPSVDLCRLATAVRCGTVADELNELPEADLVVSTVHRAKGLEFDDVFVVCFGDTGAEEDDPDEETRLLYVALTRARKTLAMVDLEKTWGLTKAKSRDDRWERRGYGAQHWGRYGIEVLGDDVDKDSPALGLPGAVGNATEMRDHFVARVRPGEGVSLMLGPVPSSAAGPRTSWHTTIERSEQPRRASQTSSIAFSVITAGKESVGTHDASTDCTSKCSTPLPERRPDAERYGLGAPAMWLRPRLVGLGRFVWNETED